VFLLAKKTNYAQLVKLGTACPFMRKIMHAHNRIIPLSPLLSVNSRTQKGCLKAMHSKVMNDIQ